METLHFGLHIVKNDRFDAQDVAARLFLCPRISPEHASRMLDMLIGGTLSLESGFPPIMMNDYDFATHQTNTDIRSFDNHEVSFDNNEDNDNSFAFLKFLNEQEKDEESAIDECGELPQENIFPLGYEWIMEDIRLVEDGAGVSFLETVKDCLEKKWKVYRQ